MYKYYAAIATAIFFYFNLSSCNNSLQDKDKPASHADSGRLAKFEPAEGKVILFIGQELEAIGGMDNYKDGYFDHFPAPGGFVQYTDFLKQGNSFGFIHKGLDGLTTLDDWGDGPENMSLTTADPDFKNSCLAIGLDISNGNDSITAMGGHDSLIYRLATWIKTQNSRPVFLRIGYEFDGFDWNHYKKEFYATAFRRIHQKFDSMGITNVAYVWQSKGGGADRKIFDEFYPGDEYVDWVAYSFFTAAEENHPMIQFARDHKKPLFIAEASPVMPDAKGVSKNLDLTKDTDAALAWKEWFTPFFRTVHNNPDVVKAIHYINSPWKTRAMWKNNNFFKNIDARITKNDSIKVWWLKETGQECYLKASDTLFSYLWKR
jgi:Glycosyl hydrolase family 26